MPPARLTAPQVAHRLGVKVETVYAYVSRGYLARERGPDGRASLFDAGEVNRLAARGRPRRSTRGPAIEVTIETAVTDIDGRRLRYRGHDAVGLARTATFEQVAELLWTGSLPGTPPRWGVGTSVVLPDGGGAIERLRAAVALAAVAPTSEAVPAPDPGGVGSLVADGAGLVATMVGALPVLGADRTPRLDLGPGGPGPVRGSVAGRLAVRLGQRRPTPATVRLVNAALVLLADHELAASTLAARIAASVRADAAAVVTAGLGPLSGRLHGTASRRARALLDEAAATEPAAAVARWADRPDGVPGLGHRLYPHGDPRASALFELLAGAGAPPRELRLVEEVLGVVRDRGLPRPNVDLALAALGRTWSWRPDAGEAVFAVARTAGWLAHAVEEYGRTPLRFRSRARYVGPPPAG